MEQLRVVSSTAGFHTSSHRTASDTDTAFCLLWNFEMPTCEMDGPQDSEMSARWFHRTNLKRPCLHFVPEDHDRSIVEQSTMVHQCISRHSQRDRNYCMPGYPFAPLEAPLLQQVAPNLKSSQIRAVSRPHCDYT